MTQTGPLRDRLLEIASRVDTGIDEVWRIARQGHAIVEARSHLEVESIRRELAAAEDDAGERWAVGSALPRTVEALRSQLEAAERMDRVIADAHSRLRLLDARLDEAVARALELSVQADRPDDLTGLHADVDVLVTEMEALRRALEETSGGNRATDTM